MNNQQTHEQAHGVNGQRTKQSGRETKHQADSEHEGRDELFMDIDRMVNEGLGGGVVSEHNGRIGETTVDTMQQQES